MTVINIKLLAEFLAKALRVRRLLEKSSTIDDKAITLLQTQALKFIKAHPKTSVGSLVRELNMSFSAVTQLVNRLVDGGWVSRENDSIDRRIVTISLTKNGKKQLQVFTKKMTSSHYAVFSSISEHDLRELVRIFTTILDSERNTR